MKKEERGAGECDDESETVVCTRRSSGGWWRLGQPAERLSEEGQGGDYERGEVEPRRSRPGQRPKRRFTGDHEEYRRHDAEKRRA